jgi:hypothetical protein
MLSNFLSRGSGDGDAQLRERGPVAPPFRVVCPRGAGGRVTYVAPPLGENFKQRDCDFDLRDACAKIKHKHNAS